MLVLRALFCAFVRMQGQELQDSELKESQVMTLEEAKSKSNLSQILAIL